MFGASDSTKLEVEMLFLSFFFFLAKVLESDLVASSLSANGRKSDYMEKN